MLPDNLLGAALRQQQSAYFCTIDGKKTTSRALCENRTALLPEAQRDRFMRTELLNNDGYGTIKLHFEHSVPIDFFAVLDQVSMRIIGWVMWYSPVGIASLIAAKVLEVEDLGDTISRLGLFCVTVMTGFAIHFLITLPLIYMLTTRKNPLHFCKGMLQ
uniref:Amino acid transporter n=1 Tax=Globodera pallida TaxID=36090 RepID=A0A183CTJ0_GLOPA